MSCYSKAQQEGVTLAPQRKRERYVAPKPDPKPLTEFETILKSGMSKEEKIKRINDILEQARKNVLT
jgi:hypothetical protein